MSQEHNDKGIWQGSLTTGGEHRGHYLSNTAAPIPGADGVLTTRLKATPFFPAFSEPPACSKKQACWASDGEDIRSPSAWQGLEQSSKERLDCESCYK